MLNLLKKFETKRSFFYTSTDELKWNYLKFNKKYDFWELITSVSPVYSDQVSKISKTIFKKNIDLNIVIINLETSI